MCSGIRHRQGSAEVLKVGGTGAERQQNRRSPRGKPPRNAEGKGGEARGGLCELPPVLF